MSESEAEDRTQAPSKQRRLLAREQGQVAHSREFTAAFGLLGASLVLSYCGQGLGEALQAVVREPFLDLKLESSDPKFLIDRLRLIVQGIATPLLLALTSFAVAAIAAHQAQVRGLWAPALLAPDPSRLWKLGQGPGLGSNASKGLLGLFKTALIALLAACLIRAEWASFQELSDQDVASIARLAGLAFCRLLLLLAFALFLLGALDYALTFLRFEASLKMTPDQQREEVRSMDGDPSLRARRRQIANAWRLDSGEVLQGASLMLTGPSGLAIVFSGGPPPKRLQIRTIVVGVKGERLREAASRLGFPMVEEAKLARKIAERRPPSLPLTPDLLNALAPLFASHTSP